MESSNTSMIIVKAFKRREQAILEGLTSPIYTTGNFWHGSDKNGTRTKNYSTDALFTRLFFCRAKRREKMFWYG